MAGKSITIEAANTMMVLYRDHVKKQATEPKKKTEFITFSLPDFMTWLNKVAPHSDELRVFLGVHPDDHPREPGRLTVLFQLYKSGKPALEPPEGKDGGGGGAYNPYDDGNSGP